MSAKQATCLAFEQGWVVKLAVPEIMRAESVMLIPQRAVPIRHRSSRSVQVSNIMPWRASFCDMAFLSPIPSTGELDRLKSCQ